MCDDGGIGRIALPFGVTQSLRPLARPIEYTLPEPGPPAEYAPADLGRPRWTPQVGALDVSEERRAMTSHTTARRCASHTAHVARHLGTWVVGACAGLLLTSHFAQAQPVSARGYLQGGVVFHEQSGVTGEVRELYVTAPGGWTTGWTVAAGFHLAELVSLEGEFAVTGLMTARESSRYDITYNEERRDLFFGANIRVHAQRPSRLQVEPVIGAALIRHQAWSQNEYARYTGTLPATVTIDPRVAKGLPMSLGLTAGLDGRIGGPRIAVVPSFRIRRRVHRLSGENDFEWWYPGGMPAWTFSAGALLRVGF